MSRTIQGGLFAVTIGTQRDWRRMSRTIQGDLLAVAVATSPGSTLQRI